MSLKSGLYPINKMQSHIYNRQIQLIFTILQLPLIGDNMEDDVHLPPSPSKDSPVEPEEESWFDEQLSQDEEEKLVEEEEEVSICIVPQEKSLELSEKEKPQWQPRKTYISYEHFMDGRYLTLLTVMSSTNLVNLREITALKEGYIDIDRKHNRLLLRAPKQEVDSSAQKISLFIDKLAVMKLQIRGTTADRMTNFQQFKEYLRKFRLVLFGMMGKSGMEIFIGGQMKLSQLRSHLEHIKSFWIQCVTIRSFRNKRSYQLIISHILTNQTVKKALEKYNKIVFAEVQKRNFDKFLRVLLGTTSKNKLGQFEYERMLVKEIQQFICIVFCYRSAERFIQLPKCGEIYFQMLYEQATKMSYLYVVGRNDEIRNKSEDLKNELMKWKNRIIGIRLFHYLSPNSKDFKFDMKRYYRVPYPSQRPYSSSTFAKTKEGFTFNLEEFYARLLCYVHGRYADSQQMIQ